MTILKHCPLVAILRGISTHDAERFVQYLIDVGFYYIEVPLNSPNAFETIELLYKKFDGKCCIGAGTVTNVEQLNKVIELGVRFIVTPNVNPEVIKLANKFDCLIFVGVMTPSEAFLAINSGAKLLKIFPTELLGENGFKALLSVLPKDIECFPVGGIKANKEQMSRYISIGAKGFGLGNSLYSEGMLFDSFKENASRFQEIWQEIRE
ncbi:2-dehydro-3-deoxy-6-phosphogalactonate aldolase [Avibacterium avium]|uniref:2-dehydro-3-deoxy-6-phosphogalactonate aldolase n=1 Tax=Avibacterium avium TaxID=751 RepID=UPI003BF7BADA